MFIQYIRYNEIYKNRIREDLEEKNHMLEKIAKIDGLTGIANRDYINDFLSKEMSRANRYETNLTIIMVDIDHFKQINDTYGHLSGDKVLINFAKVIRQNIRESDLIGRWGGEEFLIICPDTDLDSAVVITQKLQETLKYMECDTNYDITGSFGVATYRIDFTLEEFIELADERMYRAKKLGRDRIVFA